MEQKKPMELAIYNQQERIEVAGILIKNGYKVSQGKRAKTQTGKQVDYLLIVEEVDEEQKVETR